MKVIEGVRIVDRLGEVAGEVSRLRGSNRDIGFDFETTDLDPLTLRPVTVAFKPKGKTAVVFDLRQMSKQDLKDLGSMLEPLFDGQVQIVGHNLKFDLEVAWVHMGLAGHRCYDTMLAQQVIAGEGGVQKFGMGDVAASYGIDVEKESRQWFPHLDQRAEEWNAPLPAGQLKYIRQDVSVVHPIKAAQLDLIESYRLHNVISLEMRVLFALVGVELWGVQVNRSGWLEVIDRLTERMKELELVLHLGNDKFDGLDVHILKIRHDRYMDLWHPYEDWMKARDIYMATREKEWREAHGKAPGWGEAKKAYLAEWYERNGKMTKPPENKQPPNIGSWMQVRDAFNSILKPKEPIQSVSEESLKPYIKHPLVKTYLEYVGLKKVVSQYGRERGTKKMAFLDRLDAFDRLRCQYYQIGADTGRMAAGEPNLQQTPDKGAGGELRHNIIAAPGYILVDSDFSNVELRIAAELSGDKFLIEAFNSGQDLHAFTACLMFNLTIPDGEDPKEWTEGHDAVVNGRTIPKVSYRKIAKTINYMLLYGAGAGRLSSELEISVDDAKVLMKKYRQTYATVIGWIQKQKNRLKDAMDAGEERVYSETLSGRRRWFTIPQRPSSPLRKGQRLTVDMQDQYERDLDEYRGKLANIQRQLGNSPIQGLSADITKLAAALWYERVGYDDDMRLVAIIHDEFLLEVRLDKQEQARKILREVMLEALHTYLKVVDVGPVKPAATPYWKH